MWNMKVPEPEMVELLRLAGHPDKNVAQAAAFQVAKALELPLKQGVFDGDNVSWIFEAQSWLAGQEIKYPISFITRQNVREHIAYVMPNHGRLPQRKVEGDEVTVPVFNVFNSIDMNLHYVQDANWNVMELAKKALVAGFTRKMNQDGWHVLLRAAADRNIVVYDPAATAGLLTKRLINLAQIQMRRSGGGNATSLGRAALTDVCLSPELVGDIRSWDLTQIDDITRREIFLAGEGGSVLTRIFGVLLHEMDEFGVGQEYQAFYENILGGSMSGGKTEIAIGLDLTRRDSFVWPWRQGVEVFEDMTLHRRGEIGWYATARYGCAALDNSRLLILQA